MGKATIVSGGTAGLYTIRPLHNRERLDAEIARIEGIISDLEAARIDLQVALSDAEDAVGQARAAMDAAIAVMIETGDTSGIATAVKNLSLAAAHRNQAEANLALNTAQLATERLERSRLQAVPADANQSAWCADYSESLSGEVATVEIPGEGNTRIIIRPEVIEGADWLAPRDGQLFHREGQSPAQVYYNAALLPGWQKFKPTHRVGVLTSVNEATDTGNVTLDAELSSAQGLDINQSATLTGVPIVYMSCNAEAFSVNDRVLVEFIGQNWSSPRVIGFESNPKECPVVEPFWPDQARFQIQGGELVLVSDNGGYYHDTEATEAWPCSLAEAPADCADGPFSTYLGHNYIVSSPAPQDREYTRPLKRVFEPGWRWYTGPSDGGDLAGQFTTAAFPDGSTMWEDIWNLDQRVSNPTYTTRISTSDGLDIRKRSYVRAFDGQTGLRRPNVDECVRCSDPPEKAIWTQPVLQSETFLVAGGHGGGSSDSWLAWILANTTFTATITVTHTPTAATRTYEAAGVFRSTNTVTVWYQPVPAP